MAYSELQCYNSNNKTQSLTVKKNTWNNVYFVFCLFLYLFLDIYNSNVNMLSIVYLYLPFVTCSIINIYVKWQQMCFIVVVRHTSMLFTFHCATDQKCRLAVLIHVLNFYLCINIRPLSWNKTVQILRSKIFCFCSFLNDTAIMHWSRLKLFS